MAKKLKFLNAILCEHVVVGAYGKHILINVFSGDIVVGLLPAVMNFGLYVEISPETTPSTMRFDFAFDGVTFAALDATFPKPEPTSSVTVLAVPFLQTAIDHDLVFEISASAEGYSKVVIIKKRIFRGEVLGSPIFPNVSPQPF